MAEQLLFDNWNWGFKKTTTTNYNHKGKLNTKNYKKFKDICRLTQKQLKRYLQARLESYYDKATIINEDGYLFVPGTNVNVLLTAHMDTVHTSNVKDIYEYKTKDGKTILSSPQGIGGDDRCGIYAILRVLETTELRPTILFCEDEETGGVGSGKFCKSNHLKAIEKLNYMIEIDRANANDCVFYDDNNEEFQDYIEKNSETKLAYGSFSDICNLSDYSYVSSFNISCGYYNAHTTSEYVVMEELYTCIYRIKQLLKLNQIDNKSFVYEPTRYYGKWFDNNIYDIKKDARYTYGDFNYGCEFYYYVNGKKEGREYVDGNTFEECVGIFLLMHSDISWSDVYDYDIY